MIIMGMDPGTATTGYGIVEKREKEAKQGNKVVYVYHGVIQTPKEMEMPDRYLAISTQFNRLLDLHEPDVLVTEKLFFSNNVNTALSVGGTIGVLLLAAAQRGLPWVEYRPAEVKMAVVGYGAAEKKQVQYMITQMLGLDTPPKPDDAANALAIAICHAHSAHMLKLMGK